MGPGTIAGATVGCGGALERGDGTAPEPLAQLGDALGGVGAAAKLVDAAELVVTQAASKGAGAEGGCQQGLTRERALRNGAAAHSSEVTALPFSPSHSVAMPEM